MSSIDKSKSMLRLSDTNRKAHALLFAEVSSIIRRFNLGDAKERHMNKFAGHCAVAAIVSFNAVSKAMGHHDD